MLAERVEYIEYFLMSQNKLRLHILKAPLRKNYPKLSYLPVIIEPLSLSAFHAMETIWLWTAVTDILSGGLGLSDFVSKS